MVGFEAESLTTRLILAPPSALISQRVDLISDEFDTVASIDAGLSVGPGQGLDHSDIDCAALRKAGTDHERRQDSCGRTAARRSSARQRASDHFLAPRRALLPYVAVAYRIGEDRVRGSLRCGIAAPSKSAQGQNAT